MKTILFIDGVADHLKLCNTTVIILEDSQGLMDVLRWLENGRFDL